MSSSQNPQTAGPLPVHATGGGSSVSTETPSGRALMRPHAHRVGDGEKIAAIPVARRITEERHGIRRL
jgi:hypothetical protein